MHVSSRISVVVLIKTKKIEAMQIYRKRVKNLSDETTKYMKIQLKIT